MNSVPRALSQKARSNCSSVISPRSACFARAGAGPEHVDRALLLRDGGVQAVQVVQVGCVTLDGGDIATDQSHGLVQRFLAPGLDEDVRAFLDEQLGAGQCHAGRSAGDDRDLALELSHDHSVALVGLDPARP